ncbi:RNA polymerase sigma factor [Flavobacterium oreochromis]|uniref:RNA polymerase sigma factor n=1 Tax=Flavobacterium oreochromis TaxID=2906078 RepID=UPI00385BEE21
MKVINLHQDERKIIEEALKQNKQAQHQIYSKFAPKMLGVCRQYVKDLQQAEDVMITAFMKVFINLKSFEYKGSFEGWIRRIMINECISFLRVQKDVKFLEDENIIEEIHNNIEDKLSVEAIQFLIDKLPVRYKMIFNLYVIEGYKHQEIEKMLGITEGTSKSQLSRAREILQNQLQKNKSYRNGTQSI